jgi:hypothetical protein
MMVVSTILAGKEKESIMTTRIFASGGKDETEQKNYNH